MPQRLSISRNSIAHMMKFSCQVWSVCPNFGLQNPHDVSATMSDSVSVVTFDYQLVLSRTSVLCFAAFVPLRRSTAVAQHRSKVSANFCSGCQPSPPAVRVFLKLVHAASDSHTVMMSQSSFAVLLYVALADYAVQCSKLAGQVAVR